MAVSASDIRARVARGEDSTRWCRRRCSATSAEHGLYRLMDIRRKQRAVVEALEDVKGRDIVVFNTAQPAVMFERVVIASGDSSRQVKALADHVREKVKAHGGERLRRRGRGDGEWVLVDLGDIVVHVMHPTVRSFYNLEEVWGGKEVKMKAKPRPKPKQSGQKKPRPWQGCASSPSPLGCRPGRSRRATSTRGACRAATRWSCCSSPQEA